MLRFIQKAAKKKARVAFISIHPMLRFIGFRIRSDSGRRKFQYIPCYGLSTANRKLSEKYGYFNTSHVTVYQNKIHGGFHKVGNFNTSHVTVYQSRRSVKRGCLTNFNTSHVTVYPWYYRHAQQSHKYFNTSHVTVYLKMLTNPQYFSSFQYIPCYGLSPAETVFQHRDEIISIHPMLRFIWDPTQNLNSM